MKNIELYLLAALIVILIAVVWDTIKYYRGEKQKVKNLHRFAKEGEADAQYHLAEYYEKGKIVKKDVQKAAYWRQMAYFSVDRRAKGAYRDLIKKSTSNQKKQ